MLLSSSAAAHQAAYGRHFQNGCSSKCPVLKKAKSLLRPYENAAVAQLDLAQDPIPGQYDGGLDVMGFHMLLTDDDRQGYLRHVYGALKPGAPMVFYNEAYRADAYEGTVNSYQQWLDITGEDFVGAVKK